ncbi:uncharacterized protein SAPINGB_P006471 [Magnusiomyces paraingens]|uniref:RRM Nup35-type domain-containing protein n=1 Tax=Magnusiomyces paraingens TaxID=2606893 RepID=A0A5E8CA52_9ASCO|nr:uncharacterized protein SAPINGB_P006471 [Saprochaete ingens]VVT58961.1 unnamed protein product [Saprochaete ingens]
MFSTNNTTNSSGSIFGNSNSTSNLFGSSNNNPNSTSLFSSNTNNGSINTPLFGSGNNSNSSNNAPIFSGTNSNFSTSKTAPLFGSNATSNAPTVFGSNALNPVNNSNSLFNTSNASNNLTSSSLFSSSTPTNPGTGLFGGQQKPGLFNSSTSATSSQNKPLFGQSNTGGTGLLGQPQSNSLFGQGNQVSINQNNSSQSLFNMQSPFSYSNDTNVIHSLAEEGIRQSAVSISQAPSSLPLSQYSSNSVPTFSQPSNHFQPPVYNGNNTLSLNLGSTLSSGYRRPVITPSWAQERKYKSFQSATQKHVSSFNKNEKSSTSLHHRKSSLSPSQSPTAFGTSFSGVPKPSHTKKKTFVQEDPPPTKSIYDNDPRNSIGSFVNEKTTKSQPDNHISSGFGNSTTSLSSSAASKSVTSGSSQNSSAANSSASADIVSVIIFGFPASLTQSVVSYFSRFGNILENVDSNKRLHQSSKEKKNYPTQIHTGKNWLKITYENPVSAARAIQENGVVFAGQYIIGCVPATTQKLKEFEKAGAMLINDANTQEMYFNISSLMSPVSDKDKIANDQLKTPQKNELNGHGSSKSPFGNQKGSAKTENIPIITGSKHKAIKDGKNIFNSPAKQLHSPLLFRYAQENDKSANSNMSSSKRLQAGKTGWFSWTGKKAQELVFGWDDL